MKIIISESKLQNVFNTYLKSEHPHLFNLVKVPLRSEEDDTIYGYEFLDPEDQIFMYFQYFINEYDYDYVYNEKELEGFPKLVVASKLMGEIKAMFGNASYDLFKDWFEKTYNIPVNDIERRHKFYYNPEN